MVFSLTSCMEAKERKWTERRYKQMIAKFASSLEENYTDLNKDFTTLKITKEKTYKSKKDLIEQIKKDGVYDQAAHPE